MTWVIKKDSGRDLKFSGTRIAEACESPNNSSPNYSGETGRWTEYRLYRTTGGNYVCEILCRTQWQGEHDSTQTLVTKDKQEVFNFFGDSWLAKELYQDWGEEYVEEID